MNRTLQISKISALIALTFALSGFGLKKFGALDWINQTIANWQYVQREEYYLAHPEEDHRAKYLWGNGKSAESELYEANHKPRSSVKRTDASLEDMYK